LNIQLLSHKSQVAISSVQATTMSVQIKNEKVDKNEDRVVIEVRVKRRNVKEETPVEFLLILPPKEEPKEIENGDKAAKEKKG